MLRYNSYQVFRFLEEMKIRPMKYLFCILCLLLFWNLSVVSAQSLDLEGLYQKHVIAFYGDNKFLKDGHTLKVREAMVYFNQYPASKKSMEGYLLHRGLATSLNLVALGALVGSISQLTKNPRLALGLNGVALGAALVSIPFTIRSRKKLQRAVYDYNREVLVDHSRR